MTRTFFITISVLGALALSACDPDRQTNHPRRPPRFGWKPNNESDSTPPDSGNTAPTHDVGDNDAGNTSPPPPPSHEERASTPPGTQPAPKMKDYPYATPVPGKSGFVVSPYAPQSGYVDVRGFPPGTEVKDPYTQKVFLVP
jgi:hypothetical protein